MTSEGPVREQDAGPEVASNAGAEPTSNSRPKEAAGIPGSVLSPDGHFALLVHSDDRVRNIEVYEAASKRRLTRITPDKSVVVSSTNARVEWTVGNRILLTWSAGSDATSAKLYSTEGKTLLEVLGSGMVQSPSNRYLATFPTVFAERPIIKVYDLSAGRKVAERAASEGTFWVVDDIGWKGQQLVALCRDLKERTEEVRIELDALP
ncbi:MAG: hypothetical protein ACJ8AT_33300 [Hyalangium sp.]|uniref:hypothetical protein n=1 Tax=Hyalangium sp. TaxID=2028555 RepID=UPI003899A83E